jgi:uncharacterized protein
VAGRQKYTTRMIVLEIRVHPGASGDALRLLDDGTLEARLRARAVEGKANVALVALLAARLGLRKSEVRIIHGLRGRRKLVELQLGSMDELRGRLGRG